MMTKKDSFINKYVSNLRVHVLVGSYGKVWPNWNYGQHQPSYNRLYYIRDGYGYVDIDGERYYPVKDQLLLIPARSTVSFGTINKEPYTKYWIHFDAKVGDINFFEIVKTQLLLNLPDNQEVINDFETIIQNQYVKKHTAELRQCAALMDLLAIFLEHVPEDKIYIEESPVEKLNTVVAYIEANLNRDISVEEMSRIVHFHPNYFIKFFRNHMGSSPVQYVNKLKVEKAKALLTDTDRSIYEISQQLGYNEPGYFSKIFKQHVGRTPREFRKECLMKPQK